MSSEYGIEEARKVLGDLVTAAQQGTDIILTRHGRPVARITRYQEDTMTTFDPKTGRFTYADDDPRTIAEKANAAAYVAREMEDPCTCDAVAGPHVHAPYARPAGDGTVVGG